MEKVEKEAIWPGPEGMIPSLPKDASNASWHTRHFLDEILIEERIIGTREAEITMNLFGEKFASPIMMPAFLKWDYLINLCKSMPWRQKR